MVVEPASHWARPFETLDMIEVCIKVASMQDSLVPYGDWHTDHGIEALCYNATKTDEGFDDRRFFRFFFDKEEHAVEFKLRFSE